MNEWKIRLDAMGKASKVLCNGEEVRGVTAIRIEGAVGEAPRVTVTMLAMSVELEVSEPDEDGGLGRTR